MKVSSLIERLQQFDPGTEVCCVDLDRDRFVLTGDILDINGYWADEGEDSPDTIYLVMDLDV